MCLCVTRISAVLGRFASISRLIFVLVIEIVTLLSFWGVGTCHPTVSALNIRFHVIHVEDRHLKD